MYVLVTLSTLSRFGLMYLEQFEAFVGRSKALHLRQMAKQELVDLLQDYERWALHPNVRDIGPAFFDTEIQQSSFCWCRQFLFVQSEGLCTCWTATVVDLLKELVRLLPDRTNGHRGCWIRRVWSSNMKDCGRRTAPAIAKKLRV